MTFDALPSVIFDLGGVLLRWDPAAIVASVFPDPAIQSTVRAAVFDHPDWLELDRGVLGEEEAVERFVARSGQTPGAIRALLDQVPAALSPLEDTVALLTELSAAGVPLYCLSNMHARQTGFLTRRYAFFAHFRDVIFSCEIKMIKPEPEIYPYAAARFGLAPSSCLFIDDAPDNVKAAKQAGWHAIRFRNAAQCRRELSIMAKRLSGKRP